MNPKSSQEAGVPRPATAPLTGARQTMMSWSRVISLLAEVPEPYREAVQAICKGTRPFPYVVLAPAMSSARHREAEMLLCDTGDELFIWQHTRGKLGLCQYRWSSLRDVEFGNILLYTWLTFSGVDVTGAPAATTVVFNLATQRHYQPFIKKMRPAPVEGDMAHLKAEQTKLEKLTAVDYKFMNFAMESLVPGEIVRQTLFQPEGRASTGTRLGWPLYRTTTLAHLTLLTDQELILIRDDERAEKKYGRRFGGVWRYLPLRHVVSAAVTRAPAGMWRLTLELTGGDRVERLFAEAQREAVEALAASLRHP